MTDVDGRVTLLARFRVKVAIQERARAIFWPHHPILQACIGDPSFGSMLVNGPLQGTWFREDQNTPQQWQEISRASVMDVGRMDIPYSVTRMCKVKEKDESWQCHCFDTSAVQNGQPRLTYLVIDIANIQ